MYTCPSCFETIRTENDPGLILDKNNILMNKAQEIEIIAQIQEVALNLCDKDLPIKARARNKRLITKVIELENLIQKQNKSINSQKNNLMSKNLKLKYSNKRTFQKNIELEKTCKKLRLDNELNKEKINNLITDNIALKNENSVLQNEQSQLKMKIIKTNFINNKLIEFHETNSNTIRNNENTITQQDEKISRLKEIAKPQSEIIKDLNFQLKLTREYYQNKLSNLNKIIDQSEQSEQIEKLDEEF